MGRANSYYAPKEKANILRGAIDGVLCIKTASVGYDYFNDSPPEAKGAHLAPETSSEERVIALINEQLAALQAQSKPGISDGEKAHIEARQKELSDLKTDMIKIMAQKDIKASVTIDTSRAYYELVVSALFSVDRVLEKRLSDSGSFEPAGISAELEKYVKQDVKATEDKKGFLGDLQDSNKIRSLTLADAEKQLIDLELDQLQARLQTCVVRAKIS
jgi:hypothetical protein